MAQIAWNPIAIPNISSTAIEAQRAAGSSLQQAFAGMRDVLGEWEGARRDDNLAEIYRRQNEFAANNDVKGYRQAIANGNLFAGQKYLRPQDMVAARAYEADLARSRQADFSWDRSQITTKREDDTYNRLEGDRVRRDMIMQTLAPLRQAMSDGQMTREQYNAEAQKLMPGANAADIEAIFSMGDKGIQTFRGDTNWDRDTWRYGVEKENRSWTVEDRQTEQNAQALALQFQELGPNASNADMMASDAYKKADPRTRSRALQLLGRDTPLDAPAAGSFSGSGAGGLNGDYDSFVVALESSGNPNARAGTSSATGLHQFTDDTWLNTVKQGGFDWAKNKTDAQLLALRTNPEYSTQAEAHLRSQNTARLQRENLPVNNANVYAMHHFAPDQALRFARAAGNVPAERMFSQATIDANPYLKGKTKDEILSNWDRRSGGNGAVVNARSQGQTLQVGASVAAGTDQYGTLARNVIPLMNDDRDNISVAKALTDSKEGKFSGLNSGEIARRIRSVQDMYRDQNGGTGRLSAAAAAQILANNMDPYSVGDFFAGFIPGQRGSVSRGLGLNQSINIQGVRNDLKQLRPQTMTDENGRQIKNADGTVATEIPLARHYRNQSNREDIIAGSDQGVQRLTAAKAALDAQVSYDEQQGITNNPVTLRLRRNYLTLQQQWGEFVPGAVGQLQAAGQFAGPAR